jgi:uncharacterized protein YcbX
MASYFSGDPCGTSKMIIGKVSALYRYRIKSTLGEALEFATLSPGGMALDRTHALIDAQTGKVASAKRPQLWRTLLSLTSRSDSSDPGVVHIHSPEAGAVSSTDPKVDCWLTEIVGRKVHLSASPRNDLQLERSRPNAVIESSVDAQVENDIITMAEAAPNGGFFDFAPIHIVFASSLKKIAESATLDAPEEVRYRPNIVIEDGNAGAFAEHAWIGSRLTIGAAELTLDYPTPRCAIPTLAHGKLASRKGVLQAIAANNMSAFLNRGMQPCLGLYARVSRPGPVARGAPVTLI